MHAMSLFKLIVLFLGIIHGDSTSSVCYTWEDYYWQWVPFAKPNCTYNNDEVLSLEQIAAKYNNPVETVNVTTLDGYQLQLFHIKKPQGKTVVILHGIFQNSLDWFLQGNNSLPIVLGNKGYNVWIINLRGTVYGTGHTNCTILNDPNLFWDFSVHDMAVYDLPAIFKHIYDNNGNQKIVPMAHSLSSTVLMIYCSLKAKDADLYLQHVVTIPPVVYLDHLGGILSAGYYFIRILFKLLPENYIQLADLVTFGRKVSPFSMEFYKVITCLFKGWDYDEFNPLTLPILMKRFGDLIAMKVIYHYIQAKETGIFGALNGSVQYNQKHYNSTKSPVYSLANVRIPMIFINGLNDVIAPPKDVQKAFREMTNNTKCLITLSYKKYNHEDFVNAKHAKDMLYNSLADKWLKRIVPEDCNSFISN